MCTEYVSRMFRCWDVGIDNMQVTRHGEAKVGTKRNTKDREDSGWVARGTCEGPGRKHGEGIWKLQSTHTGTYDLYQLSPSLLSSPLYLSMNFPISKTYLFALVVVVVELGSGAIFSSSAHRSALKGSKRLRERRS